MCIEKILAEHKKWLNDEGGKRADLRNAYLCNADLRNADLRNADLRNADLRNADLLNADLRYAGLRYADLCGANLRGANLCGADLYGADLNNVDLDFSCLPLWCGSLKAKMDDKQVKQLLYHVLSIVKYSDNVSHEIKEKLLTDQNIEIANQFHRVKECGVLTK